MKYLRLLGLIMAGISLAAGAKSSPPAYKTSIPEEVCSLMLDEADSFLRRMPDGLQRRQTAAIRTAINGDSRMLDSVRSSRNAAIKLPAETERRDIRKGLTLFRSRRFDNDTIPLLLYLHGGGWTFGSVNSCSRYCAAMAERGIAVLALDYRLAPENPFPAGLSDCVDAARLACDSLDSWKCSGLSIGGDSSGANLAIATAITLPAGFFNSLVAFYPVTKAYADGSDSRKEFGEGFGLDSILMDTFNEAYISSEAHNPLASPAKADDTLLKKLPPTLIVAAERDILRSQGAEFAERLKNSGVPVEYVMLPGTVHLFITVEGQPTAFKLAADDSADWIHTNDRH